MSILDYRDTDRKIIEWDAKEEFESFYPDPNLSGGALPIPGKKDFNRYKLIEPIGYRLETLDKHSCRFTVLDARAQQGPWIQTMQRLTHDDTNDLLVGASATVVDAGQQTIKGFYIATVGTTSEKGRNLEFSFFFQPEGLGIMMIGHARV